LDGLSIHHQEFETVHTATGICQSDTAVCLLACLQADSSICLVAATVICQTDPAACFLACKQIAVSAWLLNVQS